MELIQQLVGSLAERASCLTWPKTNRDPVTFSN